MTKRLKAAWIKALRSGRYKQGRGTLKQTYKANPQTGDEVRLPTPEYCCLGVLCQVARIPQKDWASQDMLNSTLQERVGLEVELAGCFAEANDGQSGGVLRKLGGIRATRQRSFTQIAKLIERYVE